MRDRQQLRFCTSFDGVRLAYATVGSGLPIVKASNWLTHVEADWQSAIWRHWVDGLSSRNTYVRYDARGCGLSDRDPGAISFEAWVRDLEAVTRAAFGQRRKMVRQSLKSLGVPMEPLLAAAELKGDERAETLPVETFLKLAKARRG